jgi:hypothetical protein
MMQCAYCHNCCVSVATQVKVVILGQDPYINTGEAMGLAFSVPQGVFQCRVRGVQGCNCLPRVHTCGRVSWLQLPATVSVWQTGVRTHVYPPLTARLLSGAGCRAQLAGIAEHTTQQQE